MKKTLLIIAMTALCAAAVAQDTIPADGALPNYFRGSLPHFGDKDSVVFQTFEICQNNWNDVAFPMNAANDTLTVYGIAAAMMTEPDRLTEGSGMWEIYYASLTDTSYTNVIESLRLYDVDSLGVVTQLGEDLPVHMRTTPVTYYMEVPYTGWRGDNNSTWPVIPMYERYFVTPQSVTGQFMVGRTDQCALPANIVSGYTHPVLLVCVATNVSPYCQHTGTQQLRRLYTGETGPHYTNGTWYNKPIQGMYYFFFPILTPDSNAFGGDTVIVNPNDTVILGNDTIAMGDTLIVCDTTIIGGDTIVNYDTILAIVQSDMLQRFTSVMPNPAMGTAKVVSSFGIDMVKVYNATGTKVYDSPATGFYHNLDVSRWPSGTYLVRIHTPQGIATKRLVVSR